METVAAANEEAVEAWSGVLFDRWARYRDVLAVSIRPFSDAAYDLCRPEPGERVLDVGCGLGETTRALAGRVGPTGEVVGIDAGERFVETAADEADEAGLGNVTYVTGDVQVADLGTDFDLAFSRFGSRFFANPVAALRNVRSALRPGGRLCMVVWRNKLANEWLHRGELVVEKYLDRPEETDEPTCGPGPFSMANADTTSDVLTAAGFDDIGLRRCDISYLMGRDRLAAPARRRGLRRGPRGTPPEPRRRRLRPAPQRCAGALRRARRQGPAAAGPAQRRGARSRPRGDRGRRPRAAAAAARDRADRRRAGTRPRARGGADRRRLRAPAAPARRRALTTGPPNRDWRR
jgi:SAM-dependent methyltransferase